MTFDLFHVGIASAALLAAGVALHEHDAHIREQAVTAAVQQTQATYQKQLSDQMAEFQKEKAKRDAQYNQALGVLQKRFQQAATPQQIAELSTQVMGLKQPVTIVTPPATPTNPNPQPVAQVALSDAPFVKAYESQCETCKMALPKVQADLADREAQMKLAQQEIESIQKQRDAALTAAKGGNLWHRTVKALKYIGIGVLVGAAAVCGSQHCK